MGKIFVLLACIGTAAMISGCSNPQNGSAALSKLRADMQQQEKVEPNDRIDNIKADAKVADEKLSNATCRKNEADQKISEAAERDAVAATLVAEEQETVYVDCDGKEQNPGIIVYPTESTVVIRGPSISKTITSIAVESDRTCSKIQSDTKVADVEQATAVKDLVLEADGDVKLVVSNSNIIGITLAEGKNLLKLKYFECADSTTLRNADGSVTVTCTKKNLLAEKQVVVNAAITKQTVEGVRKEDRCEKPVEKPKTGDQE